MLIRSALLLLLACSVAALESLPRIAITAKLPSTDSLPASSALLAAWKLALDDLESDASRITQGALETGTIRSRIHGIPGTGITTQEERGVVQEHLDCITGEGEWVYEGKRGKAGVGLTVHKQESIYAACDTKFYKGKPHSQDDWEVRESLKWTWKPASTCFTSLSSSRPTTRIPLSRRRLCTLLAHKSTIMIGDTPQYSLHDLLLDWTTTKPQSCYGDRYCKEHSLCGDILKGGTGADQWRTDERVYNPLPITSRLAKRDISENHIEPRSKYSSPSYGTLLRFRRSDGLQPSSTYTQPNYVHHLTGVLEINQQWLADARRSDLVIITKPPLPLPSRAFSSYWSDWWNVVETGGEARAVMMLEGAVRLTRGAWVPELVETLRQMRKDSVEQLVVYRGGWRSHSDCGAASFAGAAKGRTIDWNSPGDGPPPHLTQPTLLNIIFEGFPPSSTIPTAARLRNIHTVFTNLQIILQNHLARRYILPEFGVPFLDLESTLSVWRSGMMGGSASSPFSSALHDQTNPNSWIGGLHLGLRTAASGDCSRYCLPSPGMAIEEAFIGGLMTLLEMGWAGSEEMSRIWVGDGFTNVRERES